jgi:hypothetical protein
MGCLEGSGVPVLYIWDARFLKVNSVTVTVQWSGYTNTSIQSNTRKYNINKRKIHNEHLERGKTHTRTNNTQRSEHVQLEQHHQR